MAAYGRYSRRLSYVCLVVYFYNSYYQHVPNQQYVISLSSYLRQCAVSPATMLQARKVAMEKIAIFFRHTYSSEALLFYIDCCACIHCVWLGHMPAGCTPQNNNFLFNGCFLLVCYCVQFKAFRLIHLKEHTGKQRVSTYAMLCIYQCVGLIWLILF